MAKPTSLSAQVQRGALEKQSAEDKEDAKLQHVPAPDGKVWVRLIRPCYDSNNVLHREGIAALYPDQVPASAKRLSAPPIADDLDE